MNSRLVSFTGLNGQGAISVPELKAGDKVFGVIMVSGTGNQGVPPIMASTFFATFVVTDGELFQTLGGNASTYVFTALID